MFPHMETTAIITALLALALGAGLGWFFGSRPAAEWKARHGERDAEARELGEKLARMAPELATMSERAARADGLAEALDRARDELTGLKAQAAGFAGLLLFLFILFQSARRRQRAPANPWGEGATTLEWTLSSPPPFHQFETLPRIDAKADH